MNLTTYVLTVAAGVTVIFIGWYASMLWHCVRAAGAAYSDWKQARRQRKADAAAKVKADALTKAMISSMRRG